MRSKDPLEAITDSKGPVSNVFEQGPSVENCQFDRCFAKSRMQNKVRFFKAMESMFVRSIFGLALLWFGLWKASANFFNIDALISNANIYYQKPLDTSEPRELILSEIEQVNSKSDIKVIVHGFVSDRRHVSISPLGNAYLARGADNVLLADWADAADLDYPSSRRAVGKVGAYFGKKLNEFFLKHDIDRNDVHIIGHSLGAHIAGNIGKYFNGSLGRVTGLDPALPLFSPQSDDSLHASDAQFVDVVHTDYPIFGDITRRGTVDFYPSFGYTPQPGCDSLDIFTASKLIFEAYSCSHNRAVLLYAESIGLPENMPARTCNFNAIKSRNVEACGKADDAVVYLGEAVSKTAVGSFYLETYDVPPYGKGAYGIYKRNS